MSLVILSPDAQADIKAAVRWYRREGSELGFRFKYETRLILGRIAKYPFAFPLVNNGIRRALLNRFPYSIYFIVKRQTVVVIAVLHQRRQDF
jgi:plasmid stabilization system protein ParE